MTFRATLSTYEAKPTFKAKPKILVNSHHHQSINQIGKNLDVSARANDSVIECIEDTRGDRFVFGVQWHPELSWQSDDISARIFGLFVERCSEYAVKKAAV